MVAQMAAVGAPTRLFVLCCCVKLYCVSRGRPSFSHTHCSKCAGAADNRTTSAGADAVRVGRPSFVYMHESAGGQQPQLRSKGADAVRDAHQPQPGGRMPDSSTKALAFPFSSQKQCPLKSGVPSKVALYLPVLATIFDKGAPCVVSCELRAYNAHVLSVSVDHEL